METTTEGKKFIDEKRLKTKSKGYKKKSKNCNNSSSDKTHSKDDNKTENDDFPKKKSNSSVEPDYTNNEDEEEEEEEKHVNKSYSKTTKKKRSESIKSSSKADLTTIFYTKLNEKGSNEKTTEYQTEFAAERNQEEKDENNISSDLEIAIDSSNIIQEESKCEIKKNNEEDYNNSQHLLEFFNPYACAKINGNIGFVRLNWLNDTSELQKELLVMCKKCNAMINSMSKVDLKKQIWECEFCGQCNKCTISPPKKMTTLEDLQINDTASKKTCIILCIDISASMNLSIPNGKDKKGRKKYLMAGKTHVSLWNQLSISICNLLENIALQYPNTIVGLVMFGNNLMIYGDCTKELFEIDGLDLNDDVTIPFCVKSELENIVRSDCKNYMTKPISKTLLKLQKKIISMDRVPDKGQTPLGPALVASQILLENAEIQSQVVVFTDGGANLGMGKLQDGEKDCTFYKEIAAEFKAKGIMVSFFTIGEKECKLSELLVVAKETQGIIKRDPNPIKPPEIKLPFYIEQIKNIRIDAIACKKLKLDSIYDMPSFNNNEHHLVQIREVSLINSVFYFEYKLSHETKFGERLPIQIKIEYSNNHKKFRRTATDYVMVVAKMPQLNFREYDILIKYGAKLEDYALREDTKDSADIKAKLERIYNGLSVGKSYNKKRELCIQKLHRQLHDIKMKKVNDDKTVTRIVDEITYEQYGIDE